MTALRSTLARIPSPRHLLFVSILLAVCLGALSGCVHVPPYERGDLARPSMNLEREKNAQDFRSHVHDSREGATGGHGSTGGGCGCN